MWVCYVNRKHANPEKINCERKAIISVCLCLINLIITLSTITATGQTFPIGIIDTYGNRNNIININSCLSFHVNDTLTFDSLRYSRLQKQVVDCLLAQPNVKQASLNVVCCTGEGKVIAFIGISDSPKPVIKQKEKKDLKLPNTITLAYDSLMVAIMDAIQKGEGQEDDSEGHALFLHAPSQRQQLKFKAFAKDNLPLLRDVLKNSTYANQRAVAATVIAYYPDKKEIVNDLVYASTDGDAGVRNDAVRALGIITDYASKHPELKIKISAWPFIQLMKSIDWTDRNKGVGILMSLTEKRDKKLLSQLKQEILEPLADMALWKSEGHAAPGYIILGRIAGWSDQKIFETSNQERVLMVNQMLADIKLQTKKG